MLKFKKITDIKDVKIIERYTSQTDSHFSNMINSVFFAWTKVYPKEYCIYNGALIIKEFDYRNDNSCEFYLPIGKNALGAIKKIVEYAQKENKDLVFSCLTEENIEMLSSKFPVTERGYDRRWSDYIYLAEDMRTFKGKKYAGQRNHINKFEKLYGSYEYKVMTKESIPEVLDFLREFGKYREFVSESEVVEYKLCFDIINNMFELGMVGGYIVNNGKIVAISVGEVRNDMLYIAIEKASRFHEGAYQVMVREFARHNTGDIVKYINREDDSGDEGLRTSKLQYKPIEIKHKHFLKIGTLFERFVYPVEIHGSSVYLDDITEEDGENFRRLCADERNNVYWGYDYKSDENASATAEYFLGFVKRMIKKKEEYSLAVRYEDKFIGEAVFHGFDYYGGVELGVRILPEYQGKNLGVSIVTAMVGYATRRLNASEIRMKCYHENVASAKMIKGAGFRKVRSDDKYHYYRIKFYKNNISHNNKT